MGFLSSRISVSAAILIGVAFFLPWVTVSCSGVSVTASGYELATGVSADEAGAAVEEESDSWPYLWVIPLCALATLYAAYRRATAGSARSEKDTVKLLYYIAGGLSILVHVVFYFDLRGDMSDAEAGMGAGMVQVSYELGWWLSLLASIAIAAVASYLVDRDEDTPSVSAPTASAGTDANI